MAPERVHLDDLDDTGLFWKDWHSHRLNPHGQVMLHNDVKTCENQSHQVGLEKYRLVSRLDDINKEPPNNPRLPPFP